MYYLLPKIVMLKAYSEIMRPIWFDVNIDNVLVCQKLLVYPVS